MKLISARVKKFRNFVDSDELEVEDSITSLIGKNESGKTSFLKALYSIKPDNPNEIKIDSDIDYPRWFKVRDAREMKSKGKSIYDISFVEAYFSLDEEDINNLSDILGIPVPNDSRLSIENNYDEKLKAGLWADEEKMIKSLFNSDIIEEEIKNKLSNYNDSNEIIEELELLKKEKVEKLDEIEELDTQINREIGEFETQKNDLEEDTEESEEQPSDDVSSNSKEISKIDEEIRKLREEIGKNKVTKDEINEKINKLNEAKDAFVKIKETIELYIPDESIDKIKEILPTFFYFGSYNTLGGRIDLEELINKDDNEITKEDQTALALLNLVGVDGQELMDNNYEIRKAELEAAASEVTRQVLNYWTQNKDIYVELDTDPETVTIQNGQKVVHRFLDVRLRDQRHQMTTNFSTRSTGFQWFFSFLVAFSDFKDQDNVIILLDEPGLGLHGSAQNDLLNFIEKELGINGQVIYTNHSPFMVNPKRLERVRLVEDNTSENDPDLGAKILNEALNVKMPETLFPLQAALGYDIAQNLFIGQNTLLVEGPSDFIYLELLSECLEGKGMVSLDNKIIITPVGGADKIPTFVALLGTHLDVTVLVDANMKDNQKIQDLIGLDILKEKRLISVGQVTKNSESANIEDIFSDDEYLSLYNEAFGQSIKPEDIPGDESIVTRIETIIGRNYNHYKPLKVLQKDLSRLDVLSDETLKRAERLFDILNKTFKEANK